MKSIGLFIAILFLVSDPAQGIVQYTVTDLGTLGGSKSFAYGINASGQVAGYSYIPGNAAGHAFLYDGSTMTDLGTLGGSTSEATGINASGQVVGDSHTAYSNFFHAFLYSGSTMTDLGTLGGSGSDANGINASGQVVGYSYTPGNAVYHAFLYSGSTMTDLGTLGGSYSVANGINANGQVVGDSTTIGTGDAVSHAFLYSGSAMTDLGTLGGSKSFAYGINASGQVAGRSKTTGNAATHAFLYSGSTMTDLGTLGGSTSEATGINASGQVVGSSSTAGDSATHPFLYSNGTMTDLNSMIASSPAWTMEYVRGINDSGQICGYGINPAGQTHAFLLTPVPEPSTLALLSMGGIGLIAFGWRRKKAHRRVVCFIALSVSAAGMAKADTFGTGAYQFNIDFVPICATNPTSDYGIVNNDYRMGTYEITNDQWNKFTASVGVQVTGADGGYNVPFCNWGTGTVNVPANNVSWYEAAQFVNWLNTSTDHQAAYKFNGTQGTSNYTFAPWSDSDAGYNPANSYRNKDAFYFLPTENEWVKAAYWNGTALQTYATKDNSFPTPGTGPSGTGWNYFSGVYATNPHGPWNVGSGRQELNGTYDMMGNNFEWMESPWSSSDYDASSLRGVRGGDWYNISYYLESSNRYPYDPVNEYYSQGFRVASVPEPGSLAMLLSIAVGGLIFWRRRTA